MNAKRTPGFPAWSFGFAIAAGLLVHTIARSEVGAVATIGVPQHRVVYVVGLTDDPTPFSTVWRKQSPVDAIHVTLNPEGEANGDGAPSILSDASTGLIAAAWARRSANGFDIVISRFVADAWTTPQVVAAWPADELDPQLVLDPNGSVHMFYWVDGTTPQVFHTVAPSDLASWSSPVLISQPAVASCRPAGAFHDGVLRVAYEVHNFGSGNTPRQVVLARYENGAFTTEVVAMTNNLGDVRPQVHSQSGRLWVDWVDTETTGGSGELAWTRQNVQGQWESIQYEPFANREQRDYLVRGGARMKAIE
jgi:hypothetical protein